MDTGTRVTLTVDGRNGVVVRHFLNHYGGPAWTMVDFEDGRREIWATSTLTVRKDGK